MAQGLRLKRKRERDSAIATNGKKRKSLLAGQEVVSDEAELLSNGSDGENGIGVGDEEEVEEWIGFASGEEETVERAEASSTHRNNDNANKPPTRDELRGIKEASELYKSNTFKLAIDALLPNVRPKESRVKPLEEFLRLLYTSLTSLSSNPPSHPLEAARILAEQGAVVPYPAPQPTRETAWKVAFEKPSDIVLVGSWATKTGVKCPGSASWTVDVAVEMPASLFQEKDYLDCRFFHKRAYYLASLALAIRSDNKLDVDTFYDSPFDARLTSVVLVPRRGGSPTDFSKLNARVRLLPVLPSPSPISLHHVSPSHCNLRIKASESDATSSTKPTPIYNADLLVHVSVRERLLRTHELVEEVPSFRDALGLLRVWANQRGYGPGPKGVIAGFETKGYFWTAVMHAITFGEETFGKSMRKGAVRKTIGRGLSSYQLFRAALELIATHDFVSEPFFIKGGSRFPRDTHASQAAVFVDSCSINVLVGVPVTSLDTLRRDAKITLSVLNSSHVGGATDPFDEVFLRDRRQLLTRFDVVFRVDLRRAALRKSSLIDTLDHCSPTQHMINAVSSLLQRALADRVHAISIVTATHDLRPLSQGNQPVNLTCIHLGLTLNTENAFRLVDHGPAATEQENQEAVEFRELWGSKAELRRFKDGRIVESVVWEVKNVDTRARIPADIVSHILSRHLGLEPDRDFKTLQKDFDDLLRVPGVLVQRAVLPGAQPGFKNALTAFDNFVRQLGNLDEEIPLAILNVSPVSSNLRYTSVFTPVPIPPKTASSLTSTMRYLPAMEIVIQFERSGRWPDDLIAIQKTKLAFLEQIANALMTKVPGLRVTIVTSTQQTTLAHLDTAYLEIVTPDGWAFAARIWHDREATLLNRILGERKHSLANGTSDSGSRYEQADKHAAQRAYEVYARRYLHAPKHHRAVANLCHRFAAFAGTTRLVKRWFSAHWLFEGHVSGEAIELLCAYVFVGSSTGGLQGGDKERIDVPGTKELGFFRVLTFLKEWGWESGLFVALYETEVAPDGDDANGVRVRAGTGSGVWTISTSEDRPGRAWTAEGPDAVVARRIKSLAAASLNYALAHEWEGFIPKTIFLHPTNDYDILIRLKPDVLCRTHQSLDPSVAVESRYANIPTTGSEDEEPLRVDFDPALMFFNDLRCIYHGTLAFFLDAYGGSVIGGVWDPSLVDERPFRVLADYSTMPSETNESGKPKGMVVLNQSTVLSEIQRFGEGIVKDIVVQRSRS